MQKLWHKQAELHSLVEAFETGDDLVLDQKLVAYDVMGSIGHAAGLAKIGLLTPEECEELQSGLQQVAHLQATGHFILSFGDEDVHTKIENHLTETVGEVGKKIHTGRSRNDQVLTAIRLYTKDTLLDIWIAALELTETLTTFAKNHSQVLMPGYTHMQKAMPSSVGMWAGALAEELLDDLVVFKAAYELNNQSPLGSAAAYGVPLPLDRQFVSALLGFKKVQSNSLYCQNSRGKIEASVIAALVSLLQSVNKCATDIALFTTSEFNFFEVDVSLCSGSSIMPQKKNVDLAELLRSKVHIALGHYTQVVSMSTNLISGYNRDLQDSKKPLFESLDLTLHSLKMTQLLISSLTVHKQVCAEALTPEIFSTHYALGLVKQGIPFREAYQRAAAEQSHVSSRDFSIKDSVHLGGLGNLGLDTIDKTLAQERHVQSVESQSFQSIKHLLLFKKGIYATKN